MFGARPVTLSPEMSSFSELPFERVPLDALAAEASSGTEAEDALSGSMEPVMAGAEAADPASGQQ